MKTNKYYLKYQKWIKRARLRAKGVVANEHLEQVF